MTSQTIAGVLEQFGANELLNAPTLPLMPASPGDLRGSHPPGQVDQEVIEAAMQALYDGQTHYVDVPGIGPLRGALADYLNGLCGSSFEADHVLVTAGMQEARFLTIQKIGEEYDGVLLPEVVHPGVRQAAGMRPLAITKLPVDPGTMLPTLAEIRRALDGGARLLFLESPSRLTGEAYDSGEVASLAELVDEHEAGVIWDQGLAPWAGGDYASLAAHSRVRERVAVMGEAWPGMGLDSWFVGYIAAPPQWFEPMRSQKQIMAICTSTASQYAALRAGQAYPETHGHQLQQLTQQRQRILGMVERKKLAVFPGDVATIVTLRLSPDEKRRVQRSLEEAGFQAADGAHFGAPDALRLAITLDDTTGQSIQSLA